MMRSVLLDANCLLLLAVGTFDAKLLGRRGLDSFTLRDFDLLQDLLEPFVDNRTTPHVLTEVDNLADRCLRPGSGREFRQFYRDWSKALNEKWFTASTLYETSAYPALGLADAAIAELARDQTTVITCDLPLCRHLWANAIEVVNFNHHRDF